MDKQEFWEQVEQRVKENQRMTYVWPLAQLAPMLEQIGLHFWKVGLVVSLGITVWVWLSGYEVVTRVVRIMVWR